MTRRRALALLVLVVAVGLLSRRFRIGFAVWDKSLGDVLYTVMVYLLVACVRPSLPPRALGAVALGVSVAVEVFQLTGIPARLPRMLQLALGTTFAWHDIVCYVVGALLAALAHVVSKRDGRSVREARSNGAAVNNHNR